MLITRLSKGSQAAPDTRKAEDIIFNFCGIPPPTPPSRKNMEKRENVWQGKFAGARILYLGEVLPLPNCFQPFATFLSTHLLACLSVAKPRQKASLMLLLFLHVFGIRRITYRFQGFRKASSLSDWRFLRYLPNSFS